MSEQTDYDRFQMSLLALRGLECWGIAAGSGTGSHVSLNFGKKIPRLKPSNNVHISKALRENMAEHCLFIQCAAWRLRSRARVICSSTSSNHEGGRMLLGLKEVTGVKVEHIALSEVTLDIAIEWQNGHVLEIFCDQAHEIDEFDNYTFLSLRGVFTVGSLSILTSKQMRKRTGHS